MKRLLLALAFILVVAGGAYAQESEISGGGGGSSSVGPGTAGAIPKFASTTTLGDSKLVTSGTNGGTLTLYDDTASTGKSILVLRDGAGQAQVPSLQFFDSAGNFKSSLSYDGLNLVASRSASNYNLTDNFLAYRLRVGDNGTISGEFAHDTTSLSLSSTFKINWANGTGYNDTKDIGLARASAGVLKVTDGSSGLGELDANFVVSNFALIDNYFRTGDTLYVSDDGWDGARAVLSASSVIQWVASGSPAAGTPDLGLARASAGVLKVTDGSSGYGVLDIAKVQGWSTKTLTESTDTGFVDIALAQNTVIGGYVEYVVRTTNGTDYTSESGQVYFTGASKTSGTVDDTDVGLVGTPVQSTTAANTFTNVFTSLAGTNKITLRCKSDSTLTGTDTITLFYRVHLNGAQSETITGL